MQETLITARPSAFSETAVPVCDVSIIIVNWNTRELLRDCIASIYANAGDTGHEIIVVDNASSDGSVEMVKTEFPDVRLVQNTENHGFARANNEGMQLAGGRYILLLNSDTRLLDNALEKVVAFADRNPDAAVVGCRVLNPDMTLQPTCFMFPSTLNMFLSFSYLYKSFEKNRWFGRERMTWWRRDDVRAVDVVTGCFMLVRRRAIQQVGMLDDRFFMYAEETDWCYRFKQAGWKVMFTPDAEIIHYGGQSSRAVRAEMLIEVRLSILKFIHKHRGRLQYAIACGLVILFAAVRLPAWLALNRLSARHRPQAAVKVRAYWGCIQRILFGKPVGARMEAGTA
ncbi:MAG TPA: glycosyltransferase family 2 protein [Anaerohalosphaeraceae bacterium]|nr:glycosyltransferase family 2 protein [Anaerohalosphaeraceae bacterium]HRT49196.1 glycosyltransferase family 2 protein [Anaerohalosphaeraceae bacterium]HRT85265.1 glycosyltransferase family 2 protein [Anaerohalosphaeraceae bacterium]